MVDEAEYQQEPLDFSKHSNLCHCPYCGETINSDEVASYLEPESNTFVCPNCRKKLDIHELRSGI